MLYTRGVRGKPLGESIERLRVSGKETPVDEERTARTAYSR
jgi:hypothetical protein